VVAALRRTHGREYRTSFRMADFATFALRLADAEGNGDAIEAIFSKLQEEQSAFALEDDQLIALLLEWLEREDHQGREVTAKELFQDLSTLARQSERKLPVTSGRSLAQRLGHLEVNLRTVVGLEVVPDAHLKQKRYRFRPPGPELRESPESAESIPAVIPPTQGARG
jgi:hypothetical protein